MLQALVEGGGALLGALVEAGLADRLVTYVAPTLLGTDGRPGVRLAGPATDRRRAALASWSTSPASVPTSGSTSTPRRRRRAALMFTGIVEELGTVRAVTPTRAARASRSTPTTVLDDATLGASIAVNGCCLTVVELGDGWWAADAVTETLDRTDARRARARAIPVNLERPVRLADRLGGHIVQGHVDGVGTVARARRRCPTAPTCFALRRARRLLRYVVEKGSITVDGISLTVVARRTTTASRSR